jgi:glucoamylase
MLRIQARAPFVLHWTRDEWRTVIDTASTMTPLGLTHVDIEVAADETAPIRFTFRWRDPERWEGRDYVIEIEPPKATATGRAAPQS